MFSSWAAVFGPPLLIVPTMGCLSYWSRARHSMRSELPRKVLHIAFGSCALCFPLFLQQEWVIVTSLALVVGWFVAVRQVPSLRRHFGCVLHSIERRSGGEFYFAIALGSLLLASPVAPLYFFIPILTLTLADAFAAIAGQTWPHPPLPGIMRDKTLAGSLVFLVIAFFCSFLPLLLASGLPFQRLLVVSGLFAVTTCVTEAVSRNGSDNLFIPASACLALYIGGVPFSAGADFYTRWLPQISFLSQGSVQ